jgi:adenylyl-sulfate kinase
MLHASTTIPAAGGALPLPGLIDDRRPAPASRQALLGHRGAIIWLTGLSGAGKSTLAQAAEARLLRAQVLPVLLDGDLLRAGLSQGLGFSEADRRENIRRATETALLVATAGAVVIVALISPFRADRQAVAAKCQSCGIPFAEVFINASLPECERRDPKQLYRRARSGEIPAFTGISSPYEPPLAPALEIQTDREPVAESARKLTALALTLANPTRSAS